MSFKPKDDWPGSFSLVSEAIDALRYNKQFLYLYVGLLTAVTAILYIADPVPFFTINNTDTPTYSTAIWVLVGAQLFMTLLLTGAATVYQLLASRRKEASLSHIIDTGFRKLPALIGLAIVSAALIMLGLILFIIPGLIIALRLTFAVYLMFDKDLGPIQAIKESFRLTKGNLVKIIGYACLVIIIVVLISLTAGLLPVIGDALGYVATLALGIVGAWLYRWADAHRE